MKRSPKRIIILVSLVLSLTVGTLIVFYVYNTFFVKYEEFNAGFFDDEPKVFEDDEGNAKGIFPELLDYIAS